ncbi:MAG: SDR family NAD(P)-dependent oxidoreductase [Rhodospirillales bacterium]
MTTTGVAISLAGKTALVTGARGGLGRAVAQRLAAAGATGVALDLQIDDSAAPPGWIARAGDVRDEASLVACVAACVQRFGGLDIVVANAGLVPPWRDTEAIDLAEWDEVFAVNVRGVVATIKCAVPALKRRGGGSIVALGSLMSWSAHPQQCCYVASKHAVLGIVRATARELGRFAIRVNAIGPGSIATDALLGRVARRARAGGPPVEEALAQSAAQTMLGRMATEEDVANTVLFLASDLAAAQTGQLVPVDCGL